CALTGLKANPNKAAWLFTAGLAWAAAVGCRASLALPIIVAYAGLFVVFLLQLKSRRALLTAAVAFSLGMGGLAWYNIARFGSVLETGHRYQLTGPAYPEVYKQVFSTTYILPSLYSDFFRPPLIDGEFPFIHAPWITESMWPFFISLPENYYYTEPISGLLFISPFILFLPMLFIKRHPRPEDLILVVSATVAILTSVTYIASAMRYLLDFSPTLILLATLGFWQCAEKPFFGWKTFGVILGVISVGFGILLGISGPTNNFLNNNYALFQWLAKLMGG
ncbi:MAG: hypothetical protein WCG34_04285, partial [Leptolinea sp.]